MKIADALRIALVLLSMEASCLVHTAPGPAMVEEAPPAEEPVYEEAPPPAAVAPAPAPAPAGDALRVKEIVADRVIARVIYAREVKASGGRVGRVFEDRDDEQWERGRGDGEIKTREVRADVIYAKEIKAGWVEAAEIHAKEVKIGC